MRDLTSSLRARRCDGCHLLAAVLAELGLRCVALHSHKSQKRRLAALHTFRAGKHRVIKCHSGLSSEHAQGSSKPLRKVARVVAFMASMPTFQVACTCARAVRARYKGL